MIDFDVLSGYLYCKSKSPAWFQQNVENLCYIFSSCSLRHIVQQLFSVLLPTCKVIFPKGSLWISWWILPTFCQEPLYPRKKIIGLKKFRSSTSELNTKTVGSELGQFTLTLTTHYLCHTFYNVAHNIIAEHINQKKNLAASCIQSSWRLYHFITENVDTTERLDWFKAQKLRMLQHKQANAVRRWRVVRRSWSRGTRIELQIWSANKSICSARVAAVRLSQRRAKFDSLPDRAHIKLVFENYLSEISEKRTSRKRSEFLP